VIFQEMLCFKDKYLHFKFNYENLFMELVSREQEVTLCSPGNISNYLDVNATKWLNVVFDAVKSLKKRSFDFQYLTRSSFVGSGE